MPRLVSCVLLCSLAVAGIAQAQIPTPDIIPTPPPMPTSNQPRATLGVTEMPDMTATPESTPDVANEPDYCEDNNALAEACKLPPNRSSGPFTFAPPGDIDFYVIDLGEGDGLATAITLRSTAQLDLYATVQRGDAALGILESDTLSTTLAADITGTLQLVVENRSPETDGTYSIEVRKTLPPASEQWQEGREPDALENNWDFANSTLVAPHTMYELNFICPDLREGACAGG
ncbi:MAG: hypothetical protein AAGF35_11915, partial [Pseudomonadota bacterium]